MKPAQGDAAMNARAQQSYRIPILIALVAVIAGLILLGRSDRAEERRTARPARKADGRAIEDRSIVLSADPFEDIPATSESEGEVASKESARPKGFPLPIQVTAWKDEIRERQGTFGYIGKGYMLSADQTGITAALPLKSVKNLPRLGLTLDEVRVGNKTIAHGGPSAPTLRSGERLIAYSRGSVEERYILHQRSFEQEFVITDLPSGRGEIEVTATVRTNLAAPAEGSRGSELRFGRDGEEFTLSQAVAVDHAGRKVPLELAYETDRVAMKVPAGWVAQAELPITIDPLVGSPTVVRSNLVNGPTGTDLVYNPATGEYLLAYTEYFGGITSDVLVLRLSATGAAIGSPVLLDTVTPPETDEQHSYFPSVSYAAGSGRFLVVWRQATSVSSNVIKGRILDNSATVLTDPFIISPEVQPNGSAFESSIATDGSRWLVGYTAGLSGMLKWVSSTGTVTAAGSPASYARLTKLAFQNNMFLILWRDDGNPRTLSARLMDASGTFVTPATVVANFAVGGGFTQAAYGADGKFAVIWVYTTTQTVRARLIDAASTGTMTFLTSEFDITSPLPNANVSDYTTDSDLSFCPTTSEWMAVYARQYASPNRSDVSLTRFTSQGTVGATDLFSNVFQSGDPQIVWNPAQSEMLVTYYTSTPTATLWSQRYAPFIAVPPAPSNLKATPGNNQVALSWGSSGGASSYTVKRATTSGGPYAAIAAGIAGTSYVDSTAANETTYYYVVTASNSGGESASSNQVQATPRAPSAQVLFVVGNTLLGTGDLAIESRLRALGYTTVIRADSVSSSSDAAGKALVVVASTITSGNVNTKFRSVAVPVINWENALYDDFGMTGLTSGTDFGTATGQTALAITNGAHPLAAGLSGTVTVSSSSIYSWGVPNANAATVATLSGNAGRAVIFGYDAGAAMPGLAAPARRVGFFLEDLTAANLNASGVLLFDAAVAWATGGSGAGAPPPPTGLVATAGNAQVSLAWNPSAGAGSYTVLRGTSTGGPYAPVATGVASPSFLDLGLTNGVTYYYVVKAQAGAASSGASNEAFATPVGVAAPALLVVGNLTLGAGDAAVKARLEGLGFAVTVKTGPTTSSSDASGKAIIVVSSTITSADVNTKFRTSSVPVITWENALNDDFGMTGLTAGTDFGTTTGQTQLAIVTPAHPLAAGLSGTVTVSSSSIYSWGVPNANAAKIATLAADASKSPIFAYEVGASMPGLVAPARRVGFFLEDLTAGNLTPQGWALFDAAVRWAVNSTPGAPPAPTDLVATGGSGQVSLSWTSSSGATSYTVKRATASGGPYSPVASGLGSPSYVDTSVTNGTTYYYVVTALIGAAESGPSNEALATPSATALPALFVVGSTTLGAGDAAVKARLEGLGFAVTVKDGPSSTTADATGKALVIISSTITSSNVNTKFRTVAVPVLNWENALYDDLGMTALTAGTDFGTTANQSTVLTINPTHPLSAGFSGTIAVTSQAQIFSWGVPNANAAQAASLVGNSGRSVIFGYEAGSSMPGLVAPARRVGFFLEDLTAASLNGNGWALFDAAVRWAIGTPSGGTPPPAPTGLTATPGNQSVVLSWTASAGATSYKVYRSTTSGTYGAPIASAVGSTTYTDAGLSNGTMYFYVVRATNAVGDSGPSSEVSATPSAGTTTPTVKSVSSISGDGTYGLGASIDITVSFSEPVTLAGGNLRVALNSGGVILIPPFGPSNVASAIYTVGAGENAADLTAASPLTLQPGATLQNAGGIPAILSIPAGANLGDLKNIVVDTSSPYVVSVTSTTPNGTYGVGAAINITIIFSEPVALGNGANLQMTPNTNFPIGVVWSGFQNAISFDYIVRPNDNTPDFTIVGPLRLTTGGTLRDAAGNDTLLTIPAGQNIGDLKDIALDGIAPRIASITSTTPNGSYLAGSSINVTVNFTEPVTLGAGNLLVALDTGAVVSIPPFTGSSAVGNYLIASGQQSNDLTAVSPLSLSAGATLRDAVGNDAILSIPAGQNLGDLKDLVIGQNPPRITSITATNPNGLYGVGTIIDLVVNFSQPVTLSSGAQLDLTMNSNATNSVGWLGFVSTIHLNYTIQAGQTSVADLTVLSPLHVTNGTLRNAAGDDAILSIPAGQNLGDLKDIAIDTAAPSVSSVSSTTANGTYGVGASINVTVTFSEPVTLAGGNLLVTLDTGAVVTIGPFGPAASVPGSYVVGAGQTSADLTALSPLALSSGATLRDAAGNSATLSIPAGQNLGDLKNIVIGASPPAVTSVTSTTPNGTYGTGASINITVTFSEAVTLSGGNLRVTLDTGAVVSIPPFAAQTSVSGTYVVASGQTSADLTAISPLALSGGTLQNASGQDAILTIPAGQNLGDLKNLVISTSSPSAPLPPTNIRVTAYATVIDVEWSASPSSNVAGYNVYRKLPTDSAWPTTPLNMLLPVPGLVLNTRFRDQTAAPSTTYQYRVTAVGN